jgi:hypothetical protein
MCYVELPLAELVVCCCHIFTTELDGGKGIQTIKDKIGALRVFEPTRSQLNAWMRTTRYSPVLNRIASVCPIR